MKSRNRSYRTALPLPKKTTHLALGRCRWLLRVRFHAARNAAICYRGSNAQIGKCPKCGFELHSCKQCTYFDPSSRFECTEKVPERISPKDKKNNCTFYSMRVMLEKETSSSAGPSAPGSGAPAAYRMRARHLKISSRNNQQESASAGKAGP